MHRKKPFSTKQKKKQLQEKRRRKQEYGPSYDEQISDEEASASRTESKHDDLKNIQQVNHQPKSEFAGKLDPNRYRLHFFQEDKNVIAKKKEFARNPYVKLPEEGLEMDLDISLESAIDIPRRPVWDYTLSKQKLESNEQRYFRDYIEKLVKEQDKLSLSYFECNLETWRQLWRVIEMSDIFLIITDIRHPLMHFPPALYRYITEDLQKFAVIVLNKVDLAPPSLVVAWQHYLKKKFPLVEIVCFTSYPKTREELETISEGVGKVVFKRRKRGTFRAMGPKELLKVCQRIVQSKVDLTSWERKIEVDQDLTNHPADSDGDQSSSDMEESEPVKKPDMSCQLENLYKDGVLTIGCVGYPNVGKSSVINGLMGKKVVSVSRTPGHTKHFQTIFLTPTVRLCDCPGLVFPSSIDRNLQVLGGIYPISQVREPFSVIGYLAQRLDLPLLLRLKPVDEDVDAKTHQWSAMDISEAWALKRGFLTAKAARLDAYRAANHLLRMSVDGRLCLCLYPSGYTRNKDVWLGHDDTEAFIKLQSMYRQSLQASNDSEEDSAESCSEDEEEYQQGRQLSAKSEEEEKSRSIVTSNPFALLGDE